MSLNSALNPHFLLEALALAVATGLYFYLRQRSGRPPFPLEVIFWLICGTLFGAWLGSKLVVLLENLTRPLSEDFWIRLIAGGKSTIGAILGGWAGIELVKRRLQLRTQTGEFFVYPLAWGTAIARIGCFTAGLEDQTHGIATGLPWGVDFGDGVARHPAQLYEAAFVLLLAIGLHHGARRRWWEHGLLFRHYVTGYLAFRLAVEFIKPREVWLAGLSATQVICAAALAWLWWWWRAVEPRRGD